MIRAFPYSRFAGTYDRLVGRAFFRRARRAFALVARRHGLVFRSAADIGCGTGLFACYLHRCWGVPVFGVDSSPQMLARARCNCADAGVCFLCQDMRRLQLPCKVDLLTANFDTLNYLVGAGELGTTFCRLFANLAPGGHLYFDIVTACRPLAGRREFLRRRVCGWPRVWQWIRWEPRRRLLHGRVIQRRAPWACPTVERHTQRAFLPGEVGAWLTAAGFVMRAVLDEAALRPTQRCPSRLLVLAQRPGPM